MFNVIFGGAFRPLFLLVALFAPLTIALWVPYYLGIWQIFPAGFNSLNWHMHEMVFGLMGAAIGGFLFTAVANWTGRTPIQGTLLVALTLAWIAGRIVMAPGLALHPMVIAVVDLSYLSLACALLWRELYLAGNKRNYIVLAVIVAFLLCNLVYHLGPLKFAEAGQWGIRGAIMVVLLLISIIGGRIIPAFTRNWLNMHKVPGEPPVNFNRLDMSAVAASVILVPCWMFAPNHVATGFLLVVASVLHGVRLTRWRGQRTLREPLLLILHIGYAWIPIGFMTLGLAVLNGNPTSAGVHALTVGAMSTMVMAISSRAALGHSGRTLRSSALLNGAFVLINVAAILRVAANLQDLGIPVYLAGLAWVVAFLCYLIAVLPILTKRPL